MLFCPPALLHTPARGPGARTLPQVPDNESKHMYDGTSARRPVASVMALSLALAATGRAVAYDVNDQLAINRLLAGAYQCQQVTGLPETDNVCRGALPFQPELSYKPTKHDQLFVKLGFATGNGLDQDSSFVLKPWAADLENGVKHINGRTRDYDFYTAEAD